MAKHMKKIVKRHGHSEAFDVKKLYASIYASVISVRGPVATAELVAQAVTDSITEWMDAKHEVTSDDIRRTAAKHLKLLDPDAAQIYEHHRHYS